MKKLIIIATAALILSGCVHPNIHRQQGAVRGCNIVGGKVTYNTFSVECKLPSGRTIITY